MQHNQCLYIFKFMNFSRTQQLAIRAIIQAQDAWLFIRSLVVRFFVWLLVAYMRWHTNVINSAPTDSPSHILYAYAEYETQAPVGPAQRRDAQAGAVTHAMDVTMLVQTFYYLRPPACKWLAQWLTRVTGERFTKVTIIRTGSPFVITARISRINLVDEVETTTGKRLPFGDVALSSLPYTTANLMSSAIVGGHPLGEILQCANLGFEGGVQHVFNDGQGVAAVHAAQDDDLLANLAALDRLG